MKENTKHQHKFNVLTIENCLNDGKEIIEVFLDCACDDDEPQRVVVFCDNDLLSAVQNYHGWLSAVAPALVAQDYRINDKRINLKGDESHDEK